MKTRRKIEPENGWAAAEPPAPPPVAAEPLAPPPAPSLDGDGAGPGAWFPAALRSDVGRVRPENQDALFGLAAWLPGATSGSAPWPFAFFAVADGLGGLTGGAQASGAAIRQVAEQVVTTF